MKFMHGGVPRSGWRSGSIGTISPSADQGQAGRGLLAARRELPDRACWIGGGTARGLLARGRGCGRLAMGAH